MIVGQVHKTMAEGKSRDDGNRGGGGADAAKRC